MPVDAPDGTLAMPTVPSLNMTDASTVGFPRESSTSLPQILDILSQQGYEFVTLSELIYKENYTINNDGRQIPLAAGKK